MQAAGVLEDGPVGRERREGEGRPYVY